MAKHVMSLEAIAKAEGTTVAAINMCLCRGLKKLRRQGLIIFTARQLAQELEAHRSHTHSLARPKSRRKTGAE